MNAAAAYERFVRPILFMLGPEIAHHLAIGSLRMTSRLPFGHRILRSFRPLTRPRTVFGLHFPNPVGLAAGFDKNGSAIPGLAALGFGFVEIGTVTAKAQRGNPTPRIFRYPEQQALINRLGFNNDGAETIARRLRKLRQSGRWPQIPVGINIGKSKVTPIEEASDDYLFSFRLLHEFADYIVLNVSSPNTPGLRTLQDHEALEQLLRVIHKKNQITRKPVLLKIAPDLSDSDLAQIVTTCEENGITGIVATNTTLDHSVIPPDRDQTGGLSGRPLRERSTRIVREICARSRLPVIASGGIFNVEDAKEKLEAGARLVQVYTGYIYRGPQLVREIVENL